MGVENQWVEVNVFERGNFRRELAKAGITFTETKSMFSSVFHIPDREQYVRIYRALKAQGLI